MPNQIKILIRADSGHDIGIGHIMRDLVLAEHLKLIKNINISFATLNIQGNINNKIKSKDFTIIPLSTNKVSELVEIINKNDINWLLIDNYEIDITQENIIKKQTNAKIFVIDDKYNKHNCDILLNHNISSKKDKYKDLVPDSTKIFAGVEYALIRDEFKKIKLTNHRKIDQNSKPKLFISIGGSDHLNLNKDIINLLSDNYILNIVTTKANKNLNQLIDNCKSKPNINLFVDNNNIEEIINKSDFAIISASVITMEMIFMEIPFIAIKTTNNQTNSYNFLNKNKFITLLAEDISYIKDILSEVFSKINMYENLYFKTKLYKLKMSSELNKIVYEIKNT